MISYQPTQHLAFAINTIIQNHSAYTVLKEKDLKTKRIITERGDRKIE